MPDSELKGYIDYFNLQNSTEIRTIIFLHQIEEENKAERNLPKVIQLVSGRARAGIQATLFTTSGHCKVAALQYQSPRRISISLT